MAKKIDASDGVEILHRLFIRGRPEREASLAQERVNISVAQLVYDLRTEAGLSQQQLARLVGTTQSVISRLEDADYRGHSLSMLKRITQALGKKLTITANAIGTEDETLRHALQTVLRNLRRAKGLSIDQLARKTGVDASELTALEHDTDCRPDSATLQRLAEFYRMPAHSLCQLAGTE
ncbi:MAG TPA: helix-turn-helix transcriptional regulator [Planctomycetota bacterium]|nr:helix-turn-helix transcriptional regulator [Planctomycetota bacterium]